MVIYENPSYYETNSAPLLSNNATSKITDDNENCVFDMLYDSALDDGPMLIDNPPCLEVVTKLCEDKDDTLVVCSGTLTHESPTLFLNSPNYTLEEKFSYVEKYLCDLQLSLVPNPRYNHNIKIDIDLNNYFERGKHANEFHNILFMCLPKIDDSNGYMVGSTYTTCNYYERGGDTIPHYATNNYKLKGAAVNIHLKISIHCYSFIYKMPMHRKEVRLRCYYFCALFFSLPGFNFSIIIIGLRSPWDPGIMYGTLPKEERHAEVQVSS
jgi:hypothetical protein